MSKKPSVAERASMATARAKNGVESTIPSISRTSPSTGPGSMAVHLARESQVLMENKNLKADLKQWEGAAPVRPVDPQLIVPSKWANRHELSYSTAEFKELKDEIEAAGGNVQPIKIRPVHGAGDERQFEIVFGHRRHRACLELALSVNAVIESITDDELFVQMERENRNRKDLTAWEQGTMYARALDEGLFPNSKKLASAIGVDLTNLGKSLFLARLPTPVIDAFHSPLVLQFRWAPLLKEALERDAEGVVERAKAITASKKHIKPAEVLKTLITDSDRNSTDNEPPPRKFSLKGNTAALMSTDPEGHVLIKFKTSLSPSSKDRLATILEEFFRSLDR